MGDPGRWRGATHGAVETGHINSHEMKSFKFVLKFEKKKKKLLRERPTGQTK